MACRDGCGCPQETRDARTSGGRSVNRQPQQQCVLCGRVEIVKPDGRGFPPDIAKRRLVKVCRASGCACEPKYTSGIALAPPRAEQ